MNYSKLLKKQIEKYLTEDQINDVSFQSFLHSINESYLNYDRDKELINHAFQVNDDEYQRLHNNLKAEYEVKRISIERLKQAVSELDDSASSFFSQDNDDILAITKYLKKLLVKRKEVEVDLKQTLNLLSTLISNLNSGVLVEDENRRIIFTNQLFCDMFSIQASPEIMKGVDCSDSAEQSKIYFKDPNKFVLRINELLKNKKEALGDILELADGRILLRDYIPIYIDTIYKGHLWNYIDVTERKRHENELINLTNIQNGILNGTDYAIIYTDTNGIIKSFNKGAEQMLGYSASEVINIETPSLIHLEKEVIEKANELTKEFEEEIKPGFDVFITKAKRNLIDTNEWTYIKKNKEQITVSLSVSCIKNVDNEIVGFLGIARDVSSTIKAQRALELSEERFRNIVEKSTDIIYKTNQNNILTYVNPVTERITGYTREELLKKNFIEFVKNEYKAEVLKFIEKQIEEQVATSYYEFPIITKTGEEKWLGQTTQLVFYSAANYEQTTHAIDITERKTYEKTLFLQKEKYQNIIANMKLGLLEVDLDDRIQYANKSFSQMSGYAIDEIVGKKAFELLLPTGTNAEINKQLEKRVLGVSDMYEMEILDKSKEKKWWIVSGAPNYDNEGNLVGSIGIHLDITEKKVLETELEISKNKAEESSKAKEAFLANMSHEIRTPLNAIIGMIRELSKEKLTDKQSTFVKNTSIASQHLLSVLNNILDMSKIEAGELQLDLHHFNINKLMSDIESIMMIKGQEKGLFLKINKNINDDVYLVGDAVRLRQIFINIIGNAIKFTQNGGITIDCIIDDAGYDYKAVSVNITDTGIGMDEAFIKKIFNKFSQEDSSTSRKYGGSGLGMAITADLIHLMNGTISLTSKKNAGTRVEMKFLLPIGDALKTENNIILDHANDLKNIRVLLVEDNEFNRTVACYTLNNYKCDITEAINGMDALEKIESGKTFDIILMDLQMPIMDGFETTQIIRNKLKMNTPIIALTANAFKTELEQCIKLGMNDYVTKPFDEEVLLNVITNCLKNGNHTK